MIYKKVFKRIMDFVLALIVLLVLNPILIVCMIVLFFTGEHEIFYFQRRMGFKNHPFFLIIWMGSTGKLVTPNSARKEAASVTVRSRRRA